MFSTTERFIMMVLAIIVISLMVPWPVVVLSILALIFIEHLHRIYFRSKRKSLTRRRRSTWE